MNETRLIEKFYSSGIQQEDYNQVPINKSKKYQERSRNYSANNGK